jgi:hypothetical protein
MNCNNGRTQLVKEIGGDMDEFRVDSFCGLYCGACDILTAYRSGKESGRKPEWNDMPAELGNLPFNARKAEIRCLGCKSQVVFIGCSKCLIRTCAMKKAGLETCLECRSYPCWRFRLTGLARRIMRLDRKLLHLGTITPNQEAIRRQGVKVWLEEQEQRWKCPLCGRRLSWYRPACPECGSGGKAAE